ncbi:MAG TPA: MDR family MFS transporter [Ktedonobacteraceae bacterium]|nr:MDR family MFS transporter [Ktedonobacteraceae bacterium]
MDDSVSTSSQTQPAAKGDERRLRAFALFSVLAALMLTLLLEALDQTVVGTALPRIVASLQGFNDYTWAVTAYTLASTTMVPTVGKLSDQFGRKWFLIIGTIIFLLGSALSGASQSMNQFIAFRALQGLGAGIGIALVFTVVGDIFPPAERAKWQGIFGVVYGFSSVVGPSLGGWLTDHGPLLGSLVVNTTRWRWVFYINLPIGMLALAALLIYLPANISERSNRFSGWTAIRRIDFSGAALAAAATICLLLGLTWGGDATYAWNSPQVIGTLVGSGVLYTLFFIVERHAAEPVLPLSLFRNQVFTASALLSLLQLMVLVGVVIYMPLFLQGVLGETASNSGLVITPLTLSSVVGAALAGAVIAMLKRYHAIAIIGAIVMTVGVFLLTLLTPSTSLFLAIVFMVIAGAGMGTFFSITTLTAQNALPRSRLGTGTSAVRYLGQLGSVLGVAIVGTVVNTTLSNDIVKRLPASTVRQLTPQGLQYATNPQVLVNAQYRQAIVQTAQHYAATSAAAHVPSGPRHNQLAAQAAAQAMQQVQHLLAQVFDALRLSLALGIQHGFVAVLIFSLLALVTTFFLKDIPLVQRYRPEASEAGASAEENEMPVIP